ncbi:hypothetical protein B7R22_11145 [Subtercola boreus]|uniref:2'-5' RNA ligase n=1 Tax=Subtercola boreus TaxID=120213 RepID=A0A3E0VXV4_9MICO|nr:2'-5' RNA ligase family protein [Subtercola boreus]RFA14153.1 hypothetical protein B7R22_11145 [Subtercola boreus]
MMSFELLLDPVTDARVRAEWQALLGAGLPSHARHTGTSNAPHITLLAARAVDATLLPKARAAAAVPGLASPHATSPHATSPQATPPQALAGVDHGPLPLAFTGFAVFGQPPSGLVLARLVVASPQLLDLHATVHRRAQGATDLSTFTHPGSWVPHVTLASRLTPAQLAEALTVLAAEERPSHSLSVMTSIPAFAGPLRQWNGDTKTVTVLPPGE